MALVVVVVGRGPGHQFVHPMKRGKRDKQQHWEKDILAGCRKEI